MCFAHTARTKITGDKKNPGFPIFFLSFLRPSTPRGCQISHTKRQGFVIFSKREKKRQRPLLCGVLGFHGRCSKTLEKSIRSIVHPQFHAEKHQKRNCSGIIFSHICTILGTSCSIFDPPPRHWLGHEARITMRLSYYDYYYHYYEVPKWMQTHQNGCKLTKISSNGMSHLSWFSYYLGLATGYSGQPTCISGSFSLFDNLNLPFFLINFGFWGPVDGHFRCLGGIFDQLKTILGHFWPIVIHLGIFSEDVILGNCCVT